MEQIIVGWAIAFFITFYSIPVIIEIAAEKKLYDIPDERKIHKQPIASLGGIGMFAGLIVAFLLTLTFTTNQFGFQYYLLAAIIIFFLGVKDDILVISAHKKFIGQLMAAAILVFKGQLLISNMQGFLGIHQLDISVARLLTLFTIVVTVNAFNLLDGADGLAGTVGSVTTLALGVYFALNNEWPHAILAFSLAGAIAAFLIYNFQPARIFMGDTGSMLIGLINAILVIRFIDLAPNFQHFPCVASPAVGFGILLLPLMDTLRVFGMRILKGKSPFSPDRNHLHHFLLDRGLSHRAVALIMGAGSLTFTLLSFLLVHIGTTYIIALQIATFFAVVYVLYITKPRMIMKVIRSEDGKEAPALVTESPKVKLISIFTGRRSANIGEAKANVEEN